MKSDILCVLAPEHDLINSEFHVDQQRLRFLGSLKLPFEYCKRYDKINIHPILQQWL